MKQETNKMQRKFTKLAVSVSVSVLASLACYGVQAAPKGVAVNIKPIKAVLQSNEDVVVNVKITNNTGVNQYVLKWYTPFSDVSEGLFDVYRDGVKVDYVGRHFKRAVPTAKDYVLLKPGKSYNQKVELSALYDMSATGNYSITYNVGSFNLFSPSISNGLVAAAKDVGELRSQSVAMWVNGRHNALASPAPSPAPTLVQSLAGSLSYTNCSSSRQTFIATAVASAKTYASNASSYLGAGKKGTRYTTWFGTYDATRYSTVKTHFANIGSAFNTKAVVVDCSCTDSGTYAYVYPTQPYKIYVCGAFWSAPNTGTDSRAGTMVHEMSHFNIVAGTDDWAYGQSAAKSLAISNPSKAVDNADSHEYFAENTPALN
jgi:peptidyl-Lys metalloendopeptidase